MLFVFLPLSLVLCTVQMAVGAIPVRFVILPQAVINVTVGVDQPPLTIRFVIGPVTLIHRPVLPVLDALTLANLAAL